MVDVAHNSGIDGGAFDPGQFPNVNGIDASDFRTEPSQLASFLLTRSRPEGALASTARHSISERGSQDGRMWRA